MWSTLLLNSYKVFLLLLLYNQYFSPSSTLFTNLFNGIKWSIVVWWGDLDGDQENIY